MTTGYIPHLTSIGYDGTTPGSFSQITYNAVLHHQAQDEWNMQGGIHHLNDHMHTTIQTYINIQEKYAMH